MTLTLPCTRFIRDAASDLRHRGVATALSLGLSCLLPLPFAACQPRTNDVRSAPATNTTSASPIAATNAANSSGESVVRPAFDAERAFKLVSEMVATGPRPAGSPELARTRSMMIRELKSYGLNVTTDEFDARTPRGTRRMANVIAELPGASSEIVIISSHYDTKFYERMRFVGANDGASSTAVVMEIARVLAAAHASTKPKVTYRFVFFDGEEAFCDNWSDCFNPDASGKPTLADNTYGSRHYAEQLARTGEASRVRALILLDLVGYKNLRFEREMNSTRWLVNTIWDTARELGHGNVFVSTEDSVEDDHIPFLKKGIDVVDIIQLGTYPHWHTAEDTLDKISAQSLKITGDVVLASLPKIEARIANTPVAAKP